MKRICHMTSAHAANDRRIFYKEAISLANAGYEVYLVARGESYDRSGVHIVGTGRTNSSRMQRLVLAAREVYQKALELDVDVYHIHDPELLPYALKLKRKGKKVIFDSHENVLGTIREKDWIPAPLRSVVYHWYDRLQRKACRQIDGVITATPDNTEKLAPFSRRAVTVTNYPVLSQEVLPADRKSRAVVYAGGISGQWNHDQIIQAVEKVPDCRYVLCGSVSDGYLERLRSLPGWEKTDFLGTIPHESVIGELAKASVGAVLLQPGENTDGKNGNLANTKLFEVMLAGLPLVCTNFVRWKEIIDRWHCGICVDPNNVDEIAGAIGYLLDHPEEARQMGENGRRAVREEFNWGVEEKKLLALYEEILKD